MPSLRDARRQSLAPDVLSTRGRTIPACVPLYFFFYRDALDDSPDGLVKVWSSADGEEYKKRQYCVYRQHDGIIRSNTSHSYAWQSSGQNVVDMGAMQLLLLAMTSESCLRLDAPSIVPGLTKAQLFFVSYCRSFCSRWSAIRDYKISSNPRPDLRCDVLFLQFPLYRNAFYCRRTPKEQCDLFF